jgi:hypothetical protein
MRVLKRFKLKSPGNADEHEHEHEHQREHTWGPPMTKRPEGFM